MAFRAGVRAATEGGHSSAFTPPGWLCAGRAADVQGKCSWELLLTDFCKTHVAGAEEHGAVRRTTPAAGSYASPLPSCSSIARAGHKGRPPICQHLPPPSKLHHLSTPQRILARSIRYLSVVSLGHPSPSFCQELKENLQSTPGLTEPNVVAWLPWGGVNFCQSVFPSAGLS